jgi:hypothetical protein
LFGVAEAAPAQTPLPVATFTQLDPDAKEHQNGKEKLTRLGFEQPKSKFQHFGMSYKFKGHITGALNYLLWLHD